MRINLRTRKNSGQTLVITALVISLLTLSIFYGVFEASRRSEMDNLTTLNDYVFVTKLGLKKTVISSLANFSSGGTNEILATNLNKYVSIVGNQAYFGKVSILFTLLDVPPYQSGLHLSWDSEGTGLSSAYANYSLVFTKTEANLQFKHETNITTKLDVEGTYNQLEGNARNLTVNCKILNEGEPSLAKNITISYELDGDPSNQEWINASSTNNIDYGNGTYRMSFIAETESVNDPMLISAQVYDMRGIFVLANATCSET